MSDEMKLLTALCDALGFEVSRIVNVTKGTHEREWPNHNVWGSEPFPSWESHEFIGGGKYIEVKRETVFNLVKRGD